MVKAATKWWRKLRSGKTGLGTFVVVGLLGMLVCSYGYAAHSTDLLISGRARVAGNYDVQNVGVRVASKTSGAYEAYNADFGARTASLYPQVTGKNNNITYAVETCNYSGTKTYELVGLGQPAAALGSLDLGIDKIEAGTNLVLGTKLAPGECIEGEISFTQTKDVESIGSLTLDYTWEEYKGVPFTISYMQEMTPQICAATSERETKQLIDQRDGHKYWVTKMHDGRCWMAQDMDYDGGGAIRFTEAQVNNLEWVVDENSSPSQYFYRGDNAKGHDSDGSFYSYTAAANVCPTGWRLATGGTGGEWDKLMDVAELNAISGWNNWATAVAGAPFYLRMTGYAGHTTKGFQGIGTDRTGWTSTRSDQKGNSTLSFGFGKEYPDQRYYVDWHDRNYFGLTVRCIAKTGAETSSQGKDLFAIETMQEMTAEVCAASQVLDSNQLRDTRDNKTYWVTKLKDNKCWMTQNLDYDGGGTRFDKNSDISKWVVKYHATPAQYYYNGDNDRGRESDGSYYSHRAALNVCPAGWRLPTGGSGGDIDTLFGGDSIGTDATSKISAIQKAPYYFWKSGFVDNEGLRNYNTEGAYRALRTASDSQLRVLDFLNTTFRPLAEDEYYFGESVRCVAGDPVAEPNDLFSVDTMQEVTTEVCMNTTTRDAASERFLTDVRDGHKYWVSRLAQDDNCWMVQNLDYDGGGTRFSKGASLSPWKLDASARQYFYEGDWATGEENSYGSYYSWQSAQNVCPTGWRLPTGGPDGEQAALLSGFANNSTGAAQLIKSPYYMVLGGYISNTGWQDDGYGYWWSSTATATGAYCIGINKRSVAPAVLDKKYWGFSVRCMTPGK